MGLKKYLLKIIATALISFSVLAATPFSSLEEFIQWEKKIKINAKFHTEYKVPDYIRLALMDSGPESAYLRYLFFTDNPQFVDDYANIHNGKLSVHPTDGSTLRKSKLENMPEEIAEYYRQNPAELLAAEGFGFDPVLARKVYNGEIQLPYGVNKTEWLRTHAWTPDGIVERNNVVAYANADYSGNYERRKFDPATGKPEEKTINNSNSSSSSSGKEEAGDQIKGHLQVLASTQKDIAVIAAKAQVVRESIALSLKSGDYGTDSVDCAGEVPLNFKARCKELQTLIKSYNDLQSNAEKLKKIISAVDSSINFPKISLDTSPVKSPVVAKSTKDIFAADKETPNCTLPVQAGWKCLKTTIKTLEGNSYNILLKWNRPNQKSKGTVFYGIGGAGMGESLEDAPSKAVMDQLDKIDQIRIVALEMLDPNASFPLAGGYWIHGGGYETLAQIFMATLELAIKKNLIHGNFTNYMGGSNGSMLLASAMARYNADTYFDRVVFQMGPFLPNLANACDKNSASSFSLSTTQQQNQIHDFLSRWLHQDPEKNVCSTPGDDRLSLLKDGLKKDYPNTIIHVIVGEKETTEGFGKWILASNQEWYNAISAKQKERILRPYMGHNNSYEDMRRFLKLAPNETPDRGMEKCKFGTFKVNNALFEYHCGCGTIPGGVLQSDGCFHKAKAQ